MIYDCFIFNDELDLLELRLRFLYNQVDKFVLVESERTLSGKKKALHYKLNQKRFKEFENKIIHLECPVNNLPNWEYEYFQRNYIKQGLKNCNNEDIIFISDADEIINIKTVLKSKDFQLPALVEIPMNYYYLNLKTNFTYSVNLVSNWSDIKDKDIGERNENYLSITTNIISPKKIITGWHFSYLFGSDTSKYQEKIKSFSHQEYNTPYFVAPKRINRCLTFGIDLFERSFMRLRMSTKNLEPLLPYLEKSRLKNLYYRRPSILKYLIPYNFLFLLFYKFIKKPGFYLYYKLIKIKGFNLLFKFIKRPGFYTKKISDRFK